MADYVLNFTGQQINELLGKINTIESLANTTADTVYNHTNSILTLDQEKQDIITTEQTSFVAKGTTVSLYKWGRLVYLRVNGTITSAWNSGSDYPVSSELADKWLPITNAMTPNTGTGATEGKFIVMTTSGGFYHTVGSNLASGNRIRCTMCYLSKA